MLDSHFDEDFTYAECERNKKIKTSFEGAMKGTTCITLEPHGGSTKATLDIEYEVSHGASGKAADKLLFERVNEKNEVRLHENLKIICELVSNPSRDESRIFFPFSIPVSLQLVVLHSNRLLFSLTVLYIFCHLFLNRSHSFRSLHAHSDGQGGHVVLELQQGHGTRC